MIRATKAVFFVAVAALAWASLASLASAAERREVRVLYDFENGSDLEDFKKFSENGACDVVQDNGVTSGKNCMRVVGKPENDFVSFQIKGDKLKDWANFDYFAMDVYIEREEKLAFKFELWDKASKNYHTRCTYEDGMLHVGKNPMMWKINRAARNGKKDGLDWSEMKPEDKIDLNGLAMVKIFFPPFKAGGNTTIWIDNLRLMQEDAAVPKFTVALPPGAKAFDFGPKAACVAGFTPIGLGSPEISGAGVTEAGQVWPDPLTGNGLENGTGPFEFNAEMPDGEYWVWLSAGRVVSEGTRALPYVLKVCGQTLCDEKLGDAEFFGAKGIFRFMKTQYSQRPNALWLDYAEPASPEQTIKVKVTGGKLNVTLCNHRLSALVAMPAKDVDAFKKLTEAIRAERIKLFTNALYFDPHPAPKKEEGDGPYVLWAPEATQAVLPWSSPGAAERGLKALDLKAAQGQRLTARICVTPFEDLGTGELEISELEGPGKIPASSIRSYYQNYRAEGSGVDEMALLPWTKIRFEPSTTWAYWLWLSVPADAKAGTYNGSLTFKPEKGGSKSLPIRLEVYPFKLDELPLSMGMYFDPWQFPAGYDRRKLIRDQFVFMREIGFTAGAIGMADVTALKGKDEVVVTFDPMLSEIAKETGMGRNPGQVQVGVYALGMARQIARLLGLRPAVDLEPGIEFTKPELKGYYQNALRQYKAFSDKMGLPVVVWVVDEPREVPNPWNRNLEQTNLYGDWAREAGVRTYVTPMSDKGGDLDYTILVDHFDVLAVHAYEGARGLIEKTKAKGKTLHFYNTGRDRLSWGFYNWRMESKGRFEWHWSFAETAEVPGYPAPEDWYTPFGGKNCLSLRAPYAEYSGGFLFKSAYFTIAEGISDSAYLVTLERLLGEAQNKPEKAKTVADARAFLDALKKAIPSFPSISNMASADAGALVGAGFNTPAAGMCETWRRKIAEYIVALNN